ncbi:flavin-containing monooxygenase [Pseudooceanicola batsensis]|uniref:flavin-containing monooxygenase n=1 Tax=Pseudooceanicola batsensis TaxID=314255 RepID=UPI000326845E|nr:NAD(P)/FAD-dependent oxidoreductase [Pseudooceanicola batsensis]
MTQRQTQSLTPRTEPSSDQESAPVVRTEVLVIGAGVCGIYTLYRLRELGFKTIVLEAGDAPGGTWYWNRYPGCRFDSESYTYGYSFSPELLQEWDWKERFAPQPETLSYLNYVVEKFDLRRHMVFGSRVSDAIFDEAENEWVVQTEDGAVYRSTYLMTAVGMLSAPTLPRIEGRESFGGTAFHTYDWPQEKTDFTGERVGVIGTGATGVQIIPVVAKQAKELYVFQRRPNWCAPLHNSPIPPEEMARIKARYDEIFEKCSKTPGGFLHGPDRRKFNEVSEEDRLAFWEELYASPGFGVWVGNFVEVLTDPEVNAEYTAFIADKIRQRVHNREVAEKLIPKDHGFGTRRVPLETRYYEAYNQDNVHLIDVKESPIERITPKGVRTADGEYELDSLIYATGFDAITGSFDRINIIGRNGQSLRDQWNEGPLTFLGVQSHGFPNLFTLAGPQGGSVSTNFPRGIEDIVDWVADFLVTLRDKGVQRVEPQQDAVDAWQKEVRDLYQMTLFHTAKSWFTGYNSNIEGRDGIRYLIYNGGSPRYRRRLEEVANKGYEGFDLQ